MQHTPFGREGVLGEDAVNVDESALPLAVEEVLNTRQRQVVVVSHAGRSGQAEELNAVGHRARGDRDFEVGEGAGGRRWVPRPDGHALEQSVRGSIP